MPYIPPSGRDNRVHSFTLFRRQTDQQCKVPCATVFFTLECLVIPTSGRDILGEALTNFDFFQSENFAIQTVFVFLLQIEH